MECFSVYADEIEGRFDPYYLKNISAIKNINTKFPISALGELSIDKVQYGANESAINGNPETDVRYIRITDIDEFGNLKTTAWKTAQKIDKRYLLKENDILFARSGATAGKTFIYKKEFGESIFAGYLIRFKIDTKKANPKYVFFYTQLNRYNAWVKSIQRPSGQPNINSEEFKSFEIPVPPFDIQNKIIDLMENAYKTKEKKEAEAKALIDSISDFILEELGISLPKVEDKICFSVASERVKNNRIDSYYHQPRFTSVENEVRKTKYDVYPLGELIVDLSGGATPKVEGDYYAGSEGVPFLRVQNISPLGIILQDVKFIKRHVHEVMLKRSQLKKDDLVFTITGRLGSVAVVPEGFEGNINQHSVRFHLKKRVDKLAINPHYIASFLNTSLGNLLAIRKATGGTRPALDYKALMSLLVPVPPLEMQEKIIKEVNSRKEQATKMHLEAKEVLERAKSEIETIILGQ